MTFISYNGYNERMDNQIYSTNEAAERIGVSERQIRFLLMQGKLSGKKMGHDWIVFSLDYKRRRRPRGYRKAVKQKGKENITSEV